MRCDILCDIIMNSEVLAYKEMLKVHEQCVNALISLRDEEITV